MSADEELPRRSKRAVVAAMRNEGLWILEWVAYYKAIGFDLIFIASNNCDDGSDRMLARLDELGEIIHLPHIPPAGTSPQEAGCDLAMRHPAMAEVEWLLHVDADEFLNVTIGEGRINDLVEPLKDADCINICWRMFGSGGLREWPGGDVMTRQTRAEGFLRRRIDPLGKSLFRPDRFGRIYSHLPKDPVSPDVVLRNTRGRGMPNNALFDRDLVRHKEASHWQFTWRNALINHYAIRARDIFLLKNHRGDGLGMSHQKYVIGSNFWRNAEKNDVEDSSILRHQPAVQAILTRLRADPVLAGCEGEAFAYVAKLRHELLEGQGLWGWNQPEPGQDAENNHSQNPGESAVAIATAPGGNTGD